MKKLFLAVFSIIIIGVFVGFNYLLWDREDKISSISSLESSNALNNSSISTLNRQIKSLEDDNDNLNRKVNELNNNKATLQTENDQMLSRIKELEAQLQIKNDNIYAMKKDITSQNMEEPVKKWIDALNKGDYETAYALYGADVNNPSNNLSSDGFASCFKDILKNIRIKSIKLYDNGEDDADKGEIIIETILDVRNVENVETGKKVFTDGINERYFKMRYDTNKKSWSIAEMTAYP